MFDKIKSKLTGQDSAHYSDQYLNDDKSNKPEWLKDRIYGKISEDGKGYSLQELEDLANQCDESECELYDLTGDLAIPPQILRDLINHVKLLQNRGEELLNSFDNIR
ncbi:hypothetical protein YerA41_090 [Yersinia phage YerA41]|nr:hypothetical protein YerA41_090 [Yersinia phage YerA41]